MAQLPRTTLLIAVLALVLVGSWVEVRPAYACSCVAHTPAAEALASADAVFAGKVSQREEHGHEATVRFVVSRVYKGTVYADQVVHTAASSSSCGIDASLGSTWVVFARAETVPVGDQVVTHLRTGLCWGNLPGGRAPQVLGQPRTPLAGASDQVERALHADAALTRGVLLAGVAALALGLGLAVWVALAWRGRRPR